VNWAAEVGLWHGFVDGVNFVRDPLYPGVSHIRVVLRKS